MNDEKKRRVLEIIVEFGEDLNAHYLEFFNRKILRECGIAGLLMVKDLFAQARTGLEREIDGFLQDYTMDEYQNLYDKILYSMEELDTCRVSFAMFKVRAEQVKIFHDNF